MDLLFGFSGRINRGQWWLAQLAMIVVIAVFTGLAMVFAPEQRPGAFDPTSGVSLLVVLGIGIILLVWINLASTVKRFHDRGKSGYWACIMLVPYIGAIWQIVECGFLAGDRGPNNFGSGGSGGWDPEDFAASVQAEYVKPQQAPIAQARQSAAVAEPAQPRRSVPSGFGRRGVS